MLVTPLFYLDPTRHSFPLERLERPLSLHPAAESKTLARSSPAIEPSQPFFFAFPPSLPHPRKTCCWEGPRFIIITPRRLVSDTCARTTHHNHARECTRKKHPTSMASMMMMITTTTTGPSQPPHNARWPSTRHSAGLSPVEPQEDRVFGQSI